MPSKLTRRNSCALAGAALLVSAVATIASHAATHDVVIDSFTVTANENFISLKWCVRGSQGRSYIYGSGGIYAEGGRITDDVGFRKQPCTGCSETSFYVDRGGVHRFTLEAIGRDGRSRTSISREVVVPMPAPPSVPKTRVDVDVFGAQDQTLQWSSRGPGCVVIRRPRSIIPIEKNPKATAYCDRWGFASTGTLRIAGNELKAPLNAYSLRSCAEPFSKRPYCGEAVPVTYVVGPARFNPPYRQFVTSSGAPYSVSWNGSSGEAWYVSVPTLGYESPPLTRPAFTFPPGILKPGLHGIRLVTCERAGAMVNRCSDGRGRGIGGGGAGKSAFAKNPASEGYSTMELVVDVPRSVPIWTEVAWNDAFSVQEFEFADRPLAGAPLDITFDGAGADIFAVGEFSSSLAHVQSGVPTDHVVPLGTVLRDGFYKRVEPFGNPFSDGTSVVTTNGERIIHVGKTAWFVQGGDSTASHGVGNHSRVVRFDPGAIDVASTPDDERFCAIHVPGNDNLAYGVEWDGSRIWIAESRIGVGRHSVLSWISPSEFTGSCNNFLNYDKPIPDDFNLCRGSTRTACVHQKELPDFSVAQLRWDSWTSCLWFTDFVGQLGRYCPSEDQVKLYALPPSHRTGGKLRMFKGMPWELTVDQDAVYLGEFRDNDLVRFDKRDASWAEIYVPVRTDQDKVHSLALHEGKLYFTVATQRGSAEEASYFGYVDVDSWRGAIRSGDPRRMPVRGTVYKQGAYASPRRLSSTAHVFRGIDVSPQGHIAIADMNDRIWRFIPKAR